ncbi:MAG: histidine kinase dimerization/phospho-acceptor domain-containing protein [Thermomicrobiales bacterium]
MRVEIAHPARAAKLATSFSVMLDERDAADERLRQFVADASHELRTPLTAIPRLPRFTIRRVR